MCSSNWPILQGGRLDYQERPPGGGSSVGRDRAEMLGVEMADFQAGSGFQNSLEVYL